MRTPEVETAMAKAQQWTYEPITNSSYLVVGVAQVLAAEVERLEELHNIQLAAISTATVQNTVTSMTDRIDRANPYWTVAYGDVCTAIDREMRERKRAEAAEARVRELEAQYACKRHNGEEAPEAAAQLTDDMLRSCQICGLTVDISKGHCEPTIEFTMQGRTDKKTKKLAELEAQNARMRAALEDIAAYDVGSRHAGTCPYGCDTPAIAQNTLAAEAGRARAATKALADGKAAP